MQKKPKALLIEDSPEYQHLIGAALKEKFDTRIARDSDEAFSALVKEAFQIILIDVGLPGCDGLSLCERLRKDPVLATTPILFITGRTEPSDLAQGFAAGADDYIYKPFRPDELLVRVEARLKKAGSATSASVDQMKRGDFLFFVGRQKVSQIAGDQDSSKMRDFNLTPNEFKILYHLAKNEGRTLSRAEILTEVWGADLHVVERTVDKHVCSLRRKLGTAAEALVSVPGQGYVFRGKQRFSAAN